MVALNIDEEPTTLWPSLLANSNDIDVDTASMPSFTELVEACPDIIEASVVWNIISPAEFSALQKRDPIVVDIEFSNLSLLDLHISVRIRSLGIDDVVYQNGRFADKYQAFSAKTNKANGSRFSIRRTEGWPVQDFDSEQDDISLVVFGCRSATTLP